MKQTMLVPPPWHNVSSAVVGEMSWLNELPNNTWCSLWRNWSTQSDLPAGYDLYIVSYHLEAIDINWVLRQCQLTSAPIVLLSDNNYYDFPKPENLYCFTYIYLHRQAEKMCAWFPDSVVKNLQYKASSVCHRISQSKLLIFTALAEELNTDALQILSTWLEGSNVHHKQKTNNKLLDSISDIFWGEYFGREIRIDNFNNSMNQQRITGDPWTPIYQNCALHFTNESFHYSLMVNDDSEFIHPGPFLTEKTLKCLVGATGFIPVGQFETYSTLKKLGFEFDYQFDLSFDQDPGNLTRLQSIIAFIADLKTMSVGDIFTATRESSLYNQEHILSGKFAEICEKVNHITKNAILTQFNR